IEVINKSLQTTKESIGQAEERIEKALRDQKAAFDADQEQRSKEFASQMEEYREASQRTKEKAREDAEAALESVRENKREADELLGAMAHRSTATDYGKWAEQQRKEARGWSLLAILLFVLGTAAFLESYFHIFTTPPQAVDSGSLWGEVLTRLGMTGVVLAGAIYEAK